MVTDTCPQCESDHLDLQAVIWSKVSPLLEHHIVQLPCDTRLSRLPFPVQACCQLLAQSYGLEQRWAEFMDGL